ncbi:hypothetical protein HDU96_004780 [Phlyctochytrium bullatum]|nr:hypothetical protein HDU96_004780 [Phlyctochytrium bullatum]
MHPDAGPPWPLLLTLVLDSCCIHRPPIATDQNIRDEHPLPPPPFFSPEELAVLESVSRDWRAICRHHVVWRHAWEWVTCTHANPFPPASSYRTWTYDTDTMAFGAVDIPAPPPNTEPRACSVADARTRCARFYADKIGLRGFAAALGSEAGREVRLVKSSRAAAEVARREQELGILLPTALKSLHAIENIQTLLRNLHGDALAPTTSRRASAAAPTSRRASTAAPAPPWPRGAGLSLVPARELALVRVPRRWVHLGDAMCAVMRAGGAGVALGVRGWAAVDAGLDGEEIVWYAIFNAESPALDPLLLAATSEDHAGPDDDDDAAEASLPLPAPRSSLPTPRGSIVSTSSPPLRASRATPRESDRVPDDLAPCWPCRLSELLAELVRETSRAAREGGEVGAVGRVVRRSVVGAAEVSEE